MAQTLSTIETLTRFHARDDSITLTNTQGLAVSNAAYRRLCNIHQWPELTREDTSLSTSDGTESYTWPSSTVFIDVTKVELQDPQDNLRYKLIAPVRTELEWSLERAKVKDFPIFYKRGHDGTNHRLYFAPIPATSSLIIRITGLIEPTAFSTSASTTIFLNTVVDEILAFMISADIMHNRAQPDQAQILLKSASDSLSVFTGREIRPEEIGNG